MNRKAFFATLLTIIAITADAQQRFFVKDSLTQDPVAFTSVWFENDTGGYTNESGMIVIPEGTKQIRLSHICYETKSISIVDCSRNTVLLVPKSVILEDVCISAKSPKRMKTTTVGMIKEKTQICHRGSNGFEMALFIPYDSTWTNAPYIHSILANLDYSTHWLTFTTIKTPIYATLRFDLRLPDSQTGAPRNESIINGGIIIQPSQRVSKEGVKLATPLVFPKTGVFVVMEWITTAAISESQNLVPAINMTLSIKENQTWNKKAFRGKDWMREEDEPINQDKSARELYKGKTPCAKLGLEISKYEVFQSDN